MQGSSAWRGVTRLAWRWIPEQNAGLTARSGCKRRKGSAGAAVGAPNPPSHIPLGGRSFQAPSVRQCTGNLAMEGDGRGCLQVLGGDPDLS